MFFLNQVGSVDPAPSVQQGLNSDTISAFLAAQPDGLTADQVNKSSADYKSKQMSCFG